jgi:esterase/lipase
MPHTPGTHEWLQSYYDDELNYKGPKRAGTLINTIIDLSLEGKNYAPNITIPVHMSVGEHENVVSPIYIKEFYENLKTPSNLKELKTYDTDHYILSDGLVVDDVICNQIKWLDSIIKQ